MGYSELKQKLNSGEVDPNQKQELLREYEYFASIAPKPFLYGLRKKLAEGRCGVLALIAILAFILVPIMLVYAPAFFFVFILILFYVYTIRPKLGKREYKTYNFTERISEPLWNSVLRHPHSSTPYPAISTVLPEKRSKLLRAEMHQEEYRDNLTLSSSGNIIYKAHPFKDEPVFKSMF